MRIVLKVSGESLKGNFNLDKDKLETIYNEVKEISKHNELLIVVGGGDFWRGRNNLGIDNSISDYIGMLGTIMNALAIESYLNTKGISASSYSTFEVSGVIKKSIKSDILNDLKK